MPLEAQRGAAHEASFAEADADGDGALDADEQAFFRDLLRARLAEPGADVLIEESGDVILVRKVRPGLEPGMGEGPRFEMPLPEGEAEPGERTFVPDDGGE
jgi:hypothetical protein